MATELRKIRCKFVRRLLLFSKNSVEKSRNNDERGAVDR